MNKLTHMLQEIRFNNSSVDMSAESGIVGAGKAPDKQFPLFKCPGNDYPVVTENCEAEPMEGVERTFPAVEGGFGLSANLDGRSPQTTPRSKATAQDPVFCFVCSAQFPTSEELRSHIRFYQVRIRRFSGNRADGHSSTKLPH